jgi:hypothetical protein
VVRQLKRLVLAAVIALLTVNVWTGAPLAALWVGSRVQTGGQATMLAIAVVAAVLALIAFLLLRLLALASATYDRVSGTEASGVRTHAPWLRSMRGERPQYPGVRTQLTAPERIFVFSVVVAVVAFEIWFFFFSGSSIDQRSGRHGQVPSKPPVVAVGRL